MAEVMSERCEIVDSKVVYDHAIAPMRTLPLRRPFKEFQRIINLTMSQSPGKQKFCYPLKVPKNDTNLWQT